MGESYGLLGKCGGREWRFSKVYEKWRVDRVVRGRLDGKMGRLSEL